MRVTVTVLLGAWRGLVVVVEAESAEEAGDESRPARSIPRDCERRPNAIAVEHHPFFLDVECKAEHYPHREDRTERTTHPHQPWVYVRRLMGAHGRRDWGY